MSIKSPSQPVYYYEASNGKFRLTYFIPPDELEKLIGSGDISNEVLDDFPDGVDLSCTEPDFQRFQKLYNYRPLHDPEALQRAFFTIFSSTHKWKQFRGSGLIRADKLEEAIGVVEDSLDKLESGSSRRGVRPVLKKEKYLSKSRKIEQKRISAHLQKLKVKGVNSKLDMRQQEFPEIKMQEGKSEEEVFTGLLRNQIKGLK